MKLTNKPYITIITPCYNEEAILGANIQTILSYLKSKEEKYKWEVLIVNDGSIDKTGSVAEKIAATENSVRVIHHPHNFNLGNALQTGFKNAEGDIIVVLDIDLSYSVEHIEVLVDTLIQASADIVVASPYIKGGRVTNVPFFRKIMSKWVNMFMRFSAQDKYYTFTCMVRAYRSSFIRTVNLKTKDYEINPEIMYKAMILRARLVEIPAHLDWTEQMKFAGKRVSSIKILRGFFSGLMAAFIFRPYIFYIVLGVILMILSIIETGRMVIATISNIRECISNHSIACSFKDSFIQQFIDNPFPMIVGTISFLVAIQFISLGFISLQNKRYFEELFHLGTAIKKNQTI